MSNLPDWRMRRLLPRWRFFDQTAISGELRSSQSSLDWIASEAVEAMFARRMAEWQRDLSVPAAADVLSLATILGEPQRAEKVAWWLMGHKPSIRPFLMTLAQQSARLVSPQSDTIRYDANVARQIIQTNRRIVREELPDSIAYVDLSLAHSILGNSSAASIAMNVALRLAPDNRFVLRSAARLWAHHKDFDKSRRVLLKSGRTSVDPWLMSAELATSSLANKPSRFIKPAKVLLSDRKFSRRAVSELAGSLGTLEALAGERRPAANHFNQSLGDPTENAVAQAVWAENQGVRLRVPLNAAATEGTAEALVWQHYIQGRWRDCLEQCWIWLRNEPFSTSPSTVGSFVASIIEDYVLSVKFAKAGQQANPRDFTILNNIFAVEIFAGIDVPTEDIIAKLDDLAQREEDRLVMLASKGLAAFARGNFQEGRAQYSKAIDQASGTSPRLAASAVAFWARAERRFGQLVTPAFVATFDSIKQLPKDATIQELRRRLVEEASISTSELGQRR